MKKIAGWMILIIIFLLAAFFAIENLPWWAYTPLAPWTVLSLILTRG